MDTWNKVKKDEYFAIIINESSIFRKKGRIYAPKWAREKSIDSGMDNEEDIDGANSVQSICTSTTIS